MATTATNSGGKRVNDWDAREIGCFWKREKQGTKEKYLTGVLSAEKIRQALANGGGEDIQLIAFANRSKNKETHPDLRLYVSDKKPTPRSTAKQPARPAPAPSAPAPMPDSSELI